MEPFPKTKVPKLPLHPKMQSSICLSLYAKQISKWFDFHGDLRFLQLRGRGNSPVHVFKLEGDQTISLGVFKLEKEAADFEKRWEMLTRMLANGCPCIPPLILNREGACLTSLGEQLYSVWQFLPPDKPKTGASFAQMLTLTADFHAYAKRHGAKGVFRTRKLEECYTLFPELFDLSLFELEKGFYEKKCWKNILYLIGYFSSVSFKRLYDSLPAHLVHGDNHTGNIVFSKGQAYLIDFDQLRTDLRLIDFPIFQEWHLLDEYLVLLKEKQLIPYLEKHYGKLEPAEREYVHTFAILRIVSTLGWLSKRAKESFIESNRDAGMQYKQHFIDLVAELEGVLSSTPASDKIFHILAP